MKAVSQKLNSIIMLTSKKYWEYFFLKISIVFVLSVFSSFPYFSLFDSSVFRLNCCRLISSNQPFLHISSVLSSSSPLSWSISWGLLVSSLPDACLNSLYVIMQQNPAYLWPSPPQTSLYKVSHCVCNLYYRCSRLWGAAASHFKFTDCFERFLYRRKQGGVAIAYR